MNGYDGVVEIDTYVNTKNFEVQIDELYDYLEQLSEEYEALEQSKPFEGKEEQLRKIRIEAEKTRNKLADLKVKQQEINNASFERFSYSLEKLLPKLARFGLSLLGIHGMFTLVSRATRTYLSQNEETAQKMNSIWTALGNLIGPIIEKIANWILKLVGYLNVFVKTLSGGKIDLTKNMNKNTKSVNGTTKAMKDLNKQMAQFDEATKLQDNTKLDSGSGAGNLDNEFKMPELNSTWVAKIEDFATIIRDNWDKIKRIALEIGTIFATAKIGEWLLNLNKLIGAGGTGVAGVGGTGVVGLTTALMATAAILATLAAVDTWTQVADNYKKLKYELEHVGEAGEEYYNTQTKIDNIAKDTKASTEDNAKALQTYNSKMASASKNVSGFTKNITTQSKVMLGWEKIILQENSTLEQNKRAIADNSTELVNNMIKTNAMIEQGKLSEEQKRNYIQTLIEEKNQLKQASNQLEKNGLQVYELDNAIRLVDNTIKKYNDTTATTTQSTSQYWGATKNSIDNVKNSINNIVLAEKEYNKTALVTKTAKIVLTSDTTGAEKNLTSFVSSLANKLQKAFDNIKPGDGFLKNLILGLKGGLPKASSVLGLARGGIVNMPGPGVPITNNVRVGENAPEGVIPLTDSQQMEMLGEAIGKYITINANITNTMNGRVISRELQKINNENDFMSNR